MNRVWIFHLKHTYDSYTLNVSETSKLRNFIACGAKEDSVVQFVRRKYPANKGRRGMSKIIAFFGSPRGDG